MNIKKTSLLLLLFCSASLMAQTVKQFAGIANDVDPWAKYENTTVALSAARFYEPEGITWDKNGYMWITEKNKIRLVIGTQVYIRAGKLGAGDMSQSYRNGTGTGGDFSGAHFFAPSSIVTDPTSGVIYIVDSYNHAIRKMDAFVNVGNGQVVSTFAGADVQTNNVGLSGKTDGTGQNARFNDPKGIVRDASGNMYVTDWSNFTIRKVTSGGVVTTLAGKAGVTGFADGTGTAATFAGPYGIAQLDLNNLVVSDMDNGTIRTVHMTTGVVTTLCGKAEDWGYVDGSFANLATSPVRFNAPRGLTVVDGKIYVCDGPVIRIIDIGAKTVSTFAGSSSATGNLDGIGTAARFGELVGIAYDGKASLYITDRIYNVIKTVTINSLAPTVSFTANKTKAVVDAEIITLTSTTTGKPSTSLQWTVSPASYSITSGTLTTAPFSVKFTATCFYNVSLRVTNTYGKDSLTKSNYISVSTVGIKEVPENISVGVYPNPSNGIFTLQSLYGNFPIQSYEVIDIAGKLILSKTCSNSLTETFDISNAQNGFYFIRVKTSQGANTLKLQKI